MTLSFITQDCPIWIMQDIGTMFFSWRLAGYDCKRLANGHYSNIVRLDRGSPYYMVWDTTQPTILLNRMGRLRKFRVYRRTRLWTLIRIVWLALFRRAKNDALPTAPSTMEEL